MTEPIPPGTIVRLTPEGADEWPDLAGQIGIAGQAWDVMTEVEWTDRSTWLMTDLLEAAR